VLLRPKFRDLVGDEEARVYVEALAGGAVLIRDPDEVPAVTADPDDDYLIALAVAVAADAIVSGDKHLTDLDDPPVSVLTPRELLDRLEHRS
jgi:predicted nucleic acid-binding protein